MNNYDNTKFKMSVYKKFGKQNMKSYEQLANNVNWVSAHIQTI